MPEEAPGLLTVDNTKEIELLTSILEELQSEKEPGEAPGQLTEDNTKELELLESILLELENQREVIEEPDSEYIDPMQETLNNILLIMQGDLQLELEEEWKTTERESIIAEIEEQEKLEQELLGLETLEEIIIEPIKPELVTTVTSNVILLTAIILVSYAVMEILRGLLNISTWLFELPMPAVFKAGLKTKSITPSRRDDD